jgi:hypothetical protein
VLVCGLVAFGVIFALSMNVGFYYMANAGGRLAGTVLSGALYQWQGLEACLWVQTRWSTRRG